MNMRKLRKEGDRRIWRGYKKARSRGLYIVGRKHTKQYKTTCFSKQFFYAQLGLQNLLFVVSEFPEIHVTSNASLTLQHKR